MLRILTEIGCVIANLIIYLAFGTLITRKRGREWPLGLSVIIGFFFYYSLFFFFCVPIMIRFRPLSMLTKLWVPAVCVVVLLSCILNGKAWYEKCRQMAGKIKAHPVFYFLIAALIIIQVMIVTRAYNFTLDAAYYVANVATNVETNMMNVYDPFTGAWLDHFEMRYFFATYQISDAVVCQLTGIPALIQTKTIMAAVIIILTNLLYYLIAQALFLDREKSVVIMLAFIFLINLTFITIYTSSLFLMTRTYEGKAIVGNLSLLAVFYLYMRLLSSEHTPRIWLMLFLVCFGSMTISSSANMLLPAELSVLLLPLAFMKKNWR
ncbi:MAG TPA: DUF6077 domain-containing protein, partial [Lachnospiraceae bacterium]|nr:DUF6077 domain-containing protein [Lachnospiraceae bacterium]